MLERKTGWAFTSLKGNEVKNRKFRKRAAIWTTLFMVSGAYHLPMAVRAQTASSVPVNQTSASSTAASGSSSTGRNLDLSSTATTVHAAHAGTITIGGQLVGGHVSGGTQMSVTQGQLLTPAENAALWQS